MNPFDSAIMSFLGHVTGQSAAFDMIMFRLKANQLLKGGAVVAVLWWLWFSNGKDSRERRHTVLVTLIGAVVAVGTARAMALLLPFRYRPMHDLPAGYQLPIGADVENLDGWSSFPSDHGALFLALATGIFFASRRVGTVVIAWVLALVLFPRVYTGQHYPTDILAGGAIGVALVALVRAVPFVRKLTAVVIDWSERNLALFSALSFIVTLEVATLFVGARGLASLAFRLLRMMVS